MWGLFGVYQSFLRTQYAFLRAFVWIAAKLSSDMKQSARKIEAVSREFTSVIGRVKISEDDWPKLCDELQSSFSKALQSDRKKTEEHDRAERSDLRHEFLQRFEAIEELLKNSQAAATKAQATLVEMVGSTSAETRINLNSLSTTIAERPKKTGRTLQAAAGVGLILLGSAGTYTYDHKELSELAPHEAQSDEDIRSLSDVDRVALKSILKFNNPREIVAKCNTNFQRSVVLQQSTCSVDLNLK